MTVRVLVADAPGEEAGLALGIQVVLDLYVRIPGDVVLALPMREAAGRGALASLIGADAARRVAEEPQPFAGHTIRVIAHDEIADGALADHLVVVGDATNDVVDAVERHIIAALVAVPRPDAELGEWAQRTHADVVRPRT